MTRPSDMDSRAARSAVLGAQSSVSGTPTFFINERRHHGAYDIGSLSAAVRTAQVEASLGVTAQPEPSGGGG